MLKAILPPFCLLMALALAITGFAMLAFGSPEDSVSLHQARAQGDDLVTVTLEQDLERRQNSRTLMITALFVSSGAMTFAAFASMSGPAKNRR